MSTISVYILYMTLKSKDLLSAWSSFFVAHAFSIQRVEEQLREGSAPLSIHEYDTLLTVSRAPEMRIRYSGLSAASVYTKSGVTRVTKRMEEKGYIERQRCEVDKRGAYAVLTQEGKKALKDTWQLFSKAILEFFEPALTQTEAKELTRLMEKVILELKPDPLVSIGSGKNAK
jgi:DNA-binding MarR family transcriptional regulator